MFHEKKYFHNFKVYARVPIKASITSHAKVAVEFCLKYRLDLSFK